MCEFCMAAANGGSEGEFNQFSGLISITPAILLFLILLLWKIRISTHIYLQSKNTSSI